MTQPPRDWDKELAAIDRVLAAPAGPPAGPPARTGGAAAPAPAPRAGPPSTVGTRHRLSTWLRVLLTAALGVGLMFWPYAHSCGLGLGLYLGAAAVAGLSGIWAAFSAWHRRQGLAHLVALVVVAWSMALGAREVLPRAGYAKQTAAWRCG